MAAYNYKGYLIKILHDAPLGDYVIPENFIAFNTPNNLVSTTDVDAWRDANNVLHRETIEKPAPKVEFNTPYIDSKFLQEVLDEIRKRYVNTSQKKLHMKVWSEEKNDYITQYFYLTSDVNFTIHKKIVRKEWVSGVLTDRTYFLYNPIRFAFIGYGSNSNS